MNQENITIDNETLNTLMESEEFGEALSTTTGLPINELGGLQDILGILFIVLAVMGGVILILFIIMAIMRVREHRATMKMRKDIEAIRGLLEKNLKTPLPSRDTILLASEPVREESKLS